MNTPKTSRNRTSAIILAGSIAALLAAQSAHAATVNWDGDTSTAWSDALNWDTLPTNDLTTDIANFNLATYGGIFAAPYFPNAGTTSINGLTIGALNAKMILTTANLSIGAGGITVANGAGAFNVAGNVTVGAAQSWVNNSKNHVMIQNDGATDSVDTGGNVLTIGGTGHTYIGSVISGTASGGLTKTGTGILTINNQPSGAGYPATLNTFAGQLTVENGTLSTQFINDANVAGALGQSNLSVILGSSGQTGILQFTGTGTSNIATSTKAFTMAASGTGAFEVTRAGINLTLNGLIDGTGAMTKMGLGTLTLGTTAKTFNGGLNVIGGGTLALDFANVGTPTDLIAATNVLTLNGGFMTIKGKTGANATSQTFASTTIGAGGGSILVDPFNGTSTTVVLDALAALPAGSALVVGKAVTANSGTVAITTANDYDAQSIYGARTVFASGAAGTGYDWATRDSSVGVGPFTLAAFGAGGVFGTYTIMGSGGANDLANVETGTLVLTGSNTHNSLKITDGAALDLDVHQLTLASGGLLSTGTTASTISGTGALGLTAGAGTGHELIVHQYNTHASGLTISAVIGNNGANAVSVTKAGTGNLILSGANTFTGQVTVQNGTLSIPTINNVSTDGTLGNSASAVIIGNAGRVRYTGNTASSDKSFTMAAGGSGSFEVSTAAQTLTLSGVIGGAGGLQMAGPGTGILKLTGTNTYTGVTTISGGTLEVSDLQNAGVASSLGAYAMPGSSGIVLNGGTLKYVGTNMTSSIDRGITIIANSTVNLPNSGIDMRIASLDPSTSFPSSNFALTVSGSGVNNNRLYIDSITTPTETVRNTGGQISPTTASVTIGTITGNGGVQLMGSSGTNNVVTGPIHMGRGYLGNTEQFDRRQIHMGAAAGATWTLMGENTFDGRLDSRAGTLVMRSPGTVISGQNVSYAFGKSSFDWVGGDDRNSYKVNLGSNAQLQLLNNVSTSYETGFRRTPILIGGSGTMQITVGPDTAGTNETHKLGNLWIRENFTLTVTGVSGFGLTLDEVRVEDNYAAQVITTNTNLTLASLRKMGTGNNNNGLTIRGTGTTTVNGTVTRQGGTGSLNLTKSEAGTLILNGQNTAPGTIAVQGGKLVAAHAEALGPIAQATTVSSGATLDVRAALVAEPISITGTGVGAAGALITADTFTGTVTGPLTLAGNTSIGGAGSTGTLNIDGILAAGANTLTTLGTGVTNFGVPSDLTSLTNLLVTDGTTNVNSALGTAGNTAVTVSDLGNGTKLRFGSVSQTLTSLTIGAGATVVFTSGLASGSLTGDDGGGKAAGFGSPASSFGGGATVPEPGTLGLLLVGALGMLNRRRRQA
jgi:fibronectin-binding autotransporter adhesin